VFASWGTPLIPGFDQAFVRITPDGGLEVRAGIHSHGQGMETSFSQIAHDILGIEFSRIKLIHGDTDRTPYSTGTYASRSLVMSGGAVASACKQLLPRMRKIAAHLLKSGDAAELEFRDGQCFCAGPSRGANGALGWRQADGRPCVEGASPAGDASVSIADVAKAWYLKPHLLPVDVDTGGLEISVGYKTKVDTGAFTYCSQAAVVAVDPQTGQIEILDYVVVED